MLTPESNYVIHSTDPVARLRHAVSTKVQLLNKKIQDRKTQEIYEDERKMSLDTVTDIMELSEAQQAVSEDEVCISILATMKSIAHTVQSKARWSKFASDHGADEEIYTFSSKGDFSKVWHITEKLTSTKPPRHIVMCTNITRFENLKQIVEYLESHNPELKKKRTLRLYFDELDKYIDQMRPLINEIIISPAISRLVIVTATPSKIWEATPGWDKLFILNPRVADSTDSYLMFKDCTYFNTDLITTVPPSIAEWLPIEKVQERKLIEHHHKVLIAHPDLGTVRTTPEGPLARVIFAPGLVSRESHELVASFWNHFGCSVMIVNGERTKDGFYGRLLLSDHSQVNIPHANYEDLESEPMKQYLRENPGFAPTSQAQLNDIIADLYIKHHLRASPLVITGRLCVERAQSLVHPVWGSFTDGIYYKGASPDDEYQQQRQLGHIRLWPTYRGIPRVFAPQKYYDNVSILEDRSDKFAKAYASSHASREEYVQVGAEGKLTSVEKSGVRAAARKETRESIVVLKCKSLEEVKKELRRVFSKAARPHEFMKKGGYELSSRLKSYYKKELSVLEADDRLTETKYALLPKSLNISSTGKGQKYMIYPVYPSMMSAPTDITYYLHYLPPTAETGAIAHVE